MTDSDCTEFERTKPRKRRQKLIKRPISRSKTVCDYLEELYKKKGSIREDALGKLINEFKKAVRYEFAQNICVTLTHRCENSLKRGSALEIDLALQLIGLLAITLGAGDHAHEIYEYSLEFLPQVLKSKSSHSAKVLECLAIVTLIGAKNTDETERSMEIIWKIMNEKETKPSVVAAAISAWSLLLSEINGWCVNHKKWKGLFSYLLKQLEEDYDQNVNSACVEALGVIFENGSLEKFSDDAENYANLKDMKDDILIRASSVTKENALKLLEDNSEKKITLTICETTLTLSTFSLVKQINYLKRYLGDGFKNHMKDNEHLHNIFQFWPETTSEDGEDLYQPEFEGVALRVFAPHIRREACTKRISMSPSSFLSKANTQLRNKYRMLAEKTKAGEYGVDQEFEYDEY
nr:PREDICTED: interferon-related developmental regulator 1-like [Nicotiana tabacum]